MARELEVIVINPKDETIERTTKVTDINAAKKLAKREYFTNGNLIQIDATTEPLTEFGELTNKQIIELIFGRYISKHKINLIKRITELNLPKNTFSEIESKGLIFILPDDRSYQRNEKNKQTEIVF